MDDNKVWDYNSSDYVEKPDRVKKFLEEIKKVCEEYQLSIWKQLQYQDEFIIEKYNPNHIKALEQAGIQLQDKKQRLQLEDAISESLMNLGVNIHSEPSSNSLNECDNFGCIISSEDGIPHIK